MPVEIKELVIKAVVSEGGGGGQGDAGSGQDNSEKIIQACVNRVLEILKDKKER
jgi:hypothetical protein